MPRSRPPYPPEFRAQIVARVRAGRAPEELANEFESSGVTLRSRIAQAAVDERAARLRRAPAQPPRPPALTAA